MRSRNCVVIGFAFALVAGVALAQTIPNWTAPPTWTPSKGMTATTMADLSNPVPFIPVTPCRVADTRNPNGAYGGPALVGALTRSFTIAGQCGIPSGAEAVSFNFTITGGTAAGDLRFYPAGSVLPLVSTINWGPTTGTLANAAVVPLGTAGAITVKNDSAASVHLIIDVNGYYARSINSNEFLGIYGNLLSGGVIYGYNSSTSGGDTSGVRGLVPSGGGGASGVLGEYYGSAAGYGVQGRIGTSAAAGAAAVFGVGANTGTITFGVLGLSGNTTNDAAGVMGRDGSTLPVITNLIGSCGTRGEGGGRGVVGVAGPSGWGVTGISVNASGNLQQWGIVGYGTSYGLYAYGNSGASGTKSFVEPHPTDARKVIRYVSLEGPEAGTYFRGKGRIVGGQAIIEVPESFRIVTDEEGLTVQVTPIGRSVAVSVASYDLNEIMVEGTRDVEFFYLVQGVRKAFKDFQPIAPGEEFKPRFPDETMPAYLTPEAQRRLIANGTYNEDGTVNMNTAERLGWAQQWREQEAAAKKAAEEAAAKQAAEPTTGGQNTQQP